MSLGIEMHEWRKQLVEKLLLNGVRAEELEKLKAAHFTGGIFYH